MSATALLLAARRACRRLHVTMLRARHAQLQLAATQLLMDPDPRTGLRLAVLMARAAAVHLKIVALELDT
jgi:hypothetical protein